MALAGTSLRFTFLAAPPRGFTVHDTLTVKSSTLMDAAIERTSNIGTEGLSDMVPLTLHTEEDFPATVTGLAENVPNSTPPLLIVPSILYIENSAEGLSTPTLAVPESERKPDGVSWSIENEVIFRFL